MENNEIVDTNTNVAIDEVENSGAFDENEYLEANPSANQLSQRQVCDFAIGAGLEMGLDLASFTDIAY